MLNWIKNHRYCLWLLYFIFYFAAFFLLERVVEPRYIIECPFDRLIPFNEWFVFPYCLWYLTMPGSLLFFMFREKETFLRLCFIMFGGMTIALVIYALFPNGLDLRVPIEGDNIAVRLCMLLQGIDTPTNVCPSIHVSAAVATDMAVQTSKIFKKNIPVRILSFAVMLLICASTVFLKQHSLWDVLWGAVLSIILLGISYTFCRLRNEKQ